MPLVGMAQGSYSETVYHHAPGNRDIPTAEPLVTTVILSVCLHVRSSKNCELVYMLSVANKL